MSTPLVCALLNFFDDWRPARELGKHGDVSEREVSRTLRRLVQVGLLLCSDDPVDPRERDMETWASWNPAAGHFHHASRTAAFRVSGEEFRRQLASQLKWKPQPPRRKVVAGASRTRLPRPEGLGAFGDVLRARRTWRRLSHRPLSDSDLSTLLGLTFGVQRTIDGGALGAGPLKTSPSGGGRHPIEAYVVVRNVAGVQPGIYHYEPYAHRLACLKPHASSRTIRAYLPQQPWYGRAGALIVMSAVFARAEWQYQYPRTYRAIAMETGHFCQTFCLVATALGLAPFCSDALDDRLVERDLGIDGVREAVLYAAGVGTRPRGSTWEPWPDEWLADPKFARAVGQPAVRTSKTRTRRVLPPSGGAGR